MIGTLYRYPHPQDPTRFIYVGQGPKRDGEHRSGRTSFGRRFKDVFPNDCLPEPIKEFVDILNQQELNELETIWMFRYHTWRGYLGGMNLTFPGSVDYKMVGSISCFETGQKAVESGQLRAAALLGGRIQGKKNADNGHMVRISALGRTPEHQSEACRKRNALYGYPQTLEGSLKGACGLWNIKRGKPCTCGKHLGETK